MYLYSFLVRRLPVLSRKSSAPQSALEAVSRALDARRAFGRPAPAAILPASLQLLPYFIGTP